MSVAEILEQAQTLSPDERKELVKLLIDTLQVSKPLSSEQEEHWEKRSTN